MILQEIGYIFLYIAAFGFSDFIVENANFNNKMCIIYYSSMSFIGISITIIHPYLKSSKLPSLSNRLPSSSELPFFGSS